MAATSPKTCDLCCHESSSWAVGQCDHPTCLNCTAKLRALCDQKECPVCRLKLDMVIVCREVRPFCVIPQSRYHGDRNYGMYFETQDLYQEYESLRENSCENCTPRALFRTFKQLRSHMSRSHDLHYCEICVENLKLFPYEFKAYSRPLLTRHRREGDSDNTSHKGHPMCKFCDNRYLDNDVLHSHLRTDHFWCHICESDGRQDYYKDYHLLRKHFRDEHFLCEEGPCREEKLTCVFRSKIDFQAHRAAAHTRGLSKAEVKQMKQVELGFSYSSGRGDGVGGGRGRAPPLFTQRGSRTAAGRREQEELEVAAALSASMPPPPNEPKKPAPNDIKKPPPNDLKKPKKHIISSTRKSPTEEAKPRKKSPTEESKPPPGFPSSVTGTGLEIGTYTQGMVVVTHTGFDPYSELVPHPKTVEPELSKPPGFENVTISKVKPKEKVEKEWPEITSAVKTAEPVKQKKAPIVVDSEMTGLQKSSFVYGGPTTKTDKSESKKKPKNVLSTAPVPKYTAESFPSLSSKTKPVSAADKTSGDESPLLRKQAATSVVEAIRSILDKTQFTKFKTLSGWYRNNAITVSEYVSQCSALFGPQWEDYGPRVASVFPEEIKQLELMAFFQPLAAPAKKTKSKKRAKESVWSSSSGGGGRQRRGGVLSDKEYPSLATASAVQSKVSTGVVGPWNTVVRT